MVYRIYAEKKPELAHEATGLATELKTFLQIEGLESIRVINRYDVEHIDPALFAACTTTVFSEPQQDITYETLPEVPGSHVFAVEYLLSGGTPAGAYCKSIYSLWKAGSADDC